MTERNGRNVSMYVNINTLKRSVHNGLECIKCHPEAGGEDFEHAFGELKMKKVSCSSCHNSSNRNYLQGMHGQAQIKGDPHAPTCRECHGEGHEMLSRLNPSSRTYKMNIPILCGKCHKEGAPVARGYNVSEHNIVENYSQGIHGKGLFQSGLIVTATCNDCHGNHKVLPHTSPNSSVSSRNIANTCMKCHARIEDVHVKVIDQELWEKKPGNIPACSDCHPPHKVKLEDRTLIEYADNNCLECHEDKNIHKTENGEKISLYVDIKDITSSVHRKTPCVKCHTDVTPSLERPCETAQSVDCSSCHEEESIQYNNSGHGKAYYGKKENAPYCSECHGNHAIKSKMDDKSLTFRTRIPKLCGDCHKKNGQANEGTALHQKDALMDYSQSVHGKSLEEKGLVSTAVCTDCHTSHYILKESDPQASIYPSNIPETCGKCHKGIYDEYIISDHSINNKDEGREFPNCAYCHTSHNIAEVNQDQFLFEISNQCGSCHKETAETYNETYHGKAYHLGYDKAAKCSDCHGAHGVYSKSNPKSTLGADNIVNTCKKCHPKSNENFTEYLAHAHHSDKEEHPVLYYTFLFMTTLLISVFVFFGIHTLLWLPRSIKELRKRKKAGINHHKKEGLFVKRFSKSQRLTHIFVIVSFILLAVTGMMLKFAHTEWAKTLSIIFGGVKGAGILHRIGAVITFGYFGFHLFTLWIKKRKNNIKFKDFIFSSKSLMFNRQDLRDFIATIKWFIGKGPKPAYGRWTYWEKFDYMAVFWGVAVIGLSGLVLWFPEMFSKMLPGWFVNVATIIHSDEALLAVGFIFTIHFFNTHFRPEAFPMDTVIFTGHIPLEELKHDRPKEYQELKASGKLEKITTTLKVSKLRMLLIKIMGFTFLTIGVIMVILIIWSLLA